MTATSLDLQDAHVKSSLPDEGMAQVDWTIGCLITVRDRPRLTPWTWRH